MNASLQLPTKRSQVKTVPSRGAIGLLLIACLSAVAAASLSRPAAAESPLVMGIPTIVDPIRGGAEPMIGVNNKTNAWVGGMTSESTQTTWFWHSADGGLSYTLAGPATGHWLCPTGEAGDQSVAIDPVTNPTDPNVNATYLMDQNLVVANTINFARMNENGSDPVNPVVPPANVSCGNHPTGNIDRPFGVVLHPTGPTMAPQFVENNKLPIVYASWDTQSPSDPSSEGMAYFWSADGVHWRVADAGVLVDNQANDGKLIAPHDLQGAMVIDPTTGYLFQAIGCSVGVGGITGAGSGCPKSATGGTPQVGVSVLKPACPATAPNCPEPASRADPNNIGQFASETYQTVATTVAGQPINNSPDNIVPGIAMDSAGTLYVLFIPGNDAPNPGTPPVPVQDFHVYYAYSTDWPDHKIWSAPVQVDKPVLSNSGPVFQTTVFPWGVAGDKGRLAVVWLGAVTSPRQYPATADPNMQDKQWHPYVSVITNAGTPSPSFHQAKVGMGPNHIGDIGLRSGGNHNLLDLISISVGPDGAVQASWANDANRLTRLTNPGTSLEIPGLPVVETSRQVGGPRLIGAGDVNDTRFSSAPTDHVNVQPGNVFYPRISDSTNPIPRSYFPQLDLTASRIESRGNCLKIHVRPNNPWSLASPNPTQPNVWWLTTWQFNSKIYFAKAESDVAGVPTFTAGMPTTFDALNIFTQTFNPKLADYSGGSTVPGAWNGNEFVITVPTSEVGLPTAGNILESVTAFSVLDNGLPPVLGATRGSGNIPDVIDATPAYNFTLAGGLNEADGDGDVSGTKGGSAHFHFHEDNCNLQPESEAFSDPSSGTDFHSTQVTSVAYDTIGHTVTIVGLGTNSGLPVPFTIVGVDSSLVPPGRFSIILGSGYSNSGNLLNGTITLH
jgi:hypothetical protein